MPRRREIATRGWVFENYVPPRIVPNEHNDTIRDCVEQLDGDDLAVVLAFFYERKTYAEIALDLELAGRTSGLYRVRRALDRLKILLEEAGIDERLWEHDDSGTGHRKAGERREDGDGDHRPPA